MLGKWYIVIYELEIRKRSQTAVNQLAVPVTVYSVEAVETCDFDSFSLTNQLQP